MRIRHSCLRRPAPACGRVTHWTHGPRLQPPAPSEKGVRYPPRAPSRRGHRAHRTSRILSFLTALTLVTVAVALIDNFLGTRADLLGHIEVRVIIVAAALAAAIGVYRETFRERTRRRDNIR
jgi:hypothetical protein